ncbi:MAG: acyl-CoA thioesterase [Maribacter sp.]
MSRYSKELVVTDKDLDDLDHVNNVRYVQWIQDISKEHWQKVAPIETQERFIWVVMTHYIEYKSSALLKDKINLNTYIKDSVGAKCTRIVEMFHGKTNKLILRSSTEWCLIDKNTQRPVRIAEDIKVLFY